MFKTTVLTDDKERQVRGNPKITCDVLGHI